MIKIVSFKICPFVQRVTALLEAKSIPYDIEYINLKDKPKWFLDMSPNGQVPILITDSGASLFESDAIMEYIDETSPPLEPDLSPEQRAIDRAWSYMAAKNYLAQCSTMRSASEIDFNERLIKLQSIFKKAETAITTGPFFKGEILSNVDIAWLPLLHRADIVKQHSGIDLLEGFPKVQIWQHAILANEIVVQSVGPDFIEKFSDFYLSEQTFLGCGSCQANTLDEQRAKGSCC